MKKPVRLRVRSHGTFQVEFKTDYELYPARDTRYAVNTYIFVPYTLGVSRRTYSNIDFHRDIQNYVRLSTPVLDLTSLVDDTSSPLVACERILEIHNWHKSRRNRKHFITNLKMIRPVLNASLRAHLRKALNRRNSGKKSKQANLVLKRSLGELVDRAGVFVERFRMLERNMESWNEDDQIVKAIRFADEAVSLVYEDALVWSYRIADKYLKGDESKKSLVRIIAQEVEYRKQRQYRAILSEDSSNEQYLQTASQLKKYTTSALYLSTATEREGATLEQFSFAIAAGLSMIFATVVAFYSQARYGVMTFPVFLALVVGYMFKDRMKEIGRNFSERLIRNIRYDQRTNLFTPDGKGKIGYMREKMTFVDQSNLPAVVERERAHAPEYPLILEEQDEEIICYAKEVNVRKSVAKQLDVGGANITGIRDIMRYDIRRYLRKTADPIEQRYMIKNGDLVTVNCHKTYLLEFVTEYRSYDVGEPIHYQHSIIELDRDGITDIHNVR